MTLEISDGLMGEVKDHAAEAFPAECCGILIGVLEGDGRSHKRVTQVRRADNRSEEATTRYIVDPKEVFEVEKELRAGDEEILGFYHSHPNVRPNPSETDRGMAWPWYSYLIVEVREEPGDFRSWVLGDDGSFMRETILLSNYEG